MIKSDNWTDWHSKKLRGEYKVDSPRVELNKQDVKTILHQYYIKGYSVEDIAGSFGFGINVVRGVVSHNLYKAWVSEWKVDNGYE